MQMKLALYFRYYKTRILLRISHVLDKILINTGLKSSHFILNYDSDSAVLISLLKYKRDVLTDVNLTECRALHPVFYRCGAEAKNPFAETLRLFGNSEVSVYQNSPMKTHYERWQPTNVAEAVGLEGADVHGDLQSAHPFDFVFPWDFKRPCDVKRFDKIERENAKFGSKSINGRNGHQCVGPVEDDKGELEFNRFTKVYKSIREKGYQRSDDIDGDLRGRIMRDGDKKAILITTGAHRAMALSALNFERISVRVYQPTIERCMVSFWPNVRNGLFTEDQALQVFDRVMNGEWPKKIEYNKDDDLCVKSLINNNVKT